MKKYILLIYYLERSKPYYDMKLLTEGTLYDLTFTNVKTDLTERIILHRKLENYL